MKVLLTHGYFLADDAKEQQIMRPYPPLGILYIAAYLDKHGIPNDVYDTTFSTKEKFRTFILTQQPELVGIYTNLMTKLNVLEAIHFIKVNLPQTTIVLGGPDVRYNAENYLREGADLIAMGEGEATMLEVVQHFKTSAADFSNIAGIAFLQHGIYTETPEREKIKDLDDLPSPAREKIDLRQYLDAWKNHHGKNAVSVSTMRGCPYTCKWCSRAVYGLSYRRRSPERVVEELMSIKEKYNPDSLWFVDDVFTISHKWLKNFTLELQRKDLKISYECITRADRMNEEVIAQLKESGCFRVWIGAESGSQKVIDLMERRVDVNQVREMIILSKKYDIEAGTFIMLGYPGETERDIEETIHHLKESNPDHFTVTVAYPIKGTELYEEVEADRSMPMDWSISTDRQIEFKRTYPRKYYDFAVKRVISELNYFKLKNKVSYAAGRYKMKSILAKLAMYYHRTT
jgi:anaerobic magnesium-protoporphyrin IX monomethyl ester cyclase